MGRWNWFNKKRGWEKMNASEYPNLIEMFEETIYEAKEFGIFPNNIDDIGYYFYNRLTAIASCHWHKYSTGEIDLGFAFNKEVVKQIPLEKLRETVIHEVGHACSIGDGHGQKWQRACQLLGKKYGFDFFHRTEQSAAINAVMRQQKMARIKYIVSCPACGASWRYAKAGRVVQCYQRCTCGCGWKGLELQVL